MKRYALVAAAMSGAVASPVLADMSVSMTVSNLKVTLFDLNPADGVTPNIVWSPGSGVDAASGSALDPVTGISSAFHERGSGPWSSISGSVATGSTQARASITSDNGVDPSGLQMAASGSAQFPTIAGRPARFSASAGVPFSGFVLSPNTVAVFTVDAIGSARTTFGYQLGDGASEFAVAHADLVVTSFTGRDNTDYQESRDLVYVTANWASELTYNPSTGRNEITYIGESRSFSGLLSGAYLNHENTAKAGYLGLNAYVEGQSYGTLVPEPETYALMLAGLGMIGFISRGRLRRG